MQHEDCQELAKLWREYGQTQPLRDMFATSEAKQLNAIKDVDNPGFYAKLDAEVMKDPVMQKFGKALGDMTLVQALWKQLGPKENRTDQINKALFVCHKHVLCASRPLVEFAEKALQSLAEERRVQQQATPQHTVPPPPLTQAATPKAT